MSGMGDVRYDEMGERIRNRRRELGMTQGMLAEAAEISISFVGHIERALKIPSIETLARICSCMDASMDYIVYGRKQACDRERCPVYRDIQAVLDAYSDKR